MGNPDSPKPAFETQSLCEAADVFHMLGTSVRLQILLLLQKSPLDRRQLIEGVGHAADAALSSLVEFGLIIEKDGRYRSDPKFKDFIHPDKLREIQGLPEKPMDISHELNKIYLGILGAIPLERDQDRWTDEWRKRARKQAKQALQKGDNAKLCLIKYINGVEGTWGIKLNFNPEQLAYLGLDSNI